MQIFNQSEGSLKIEINDEIGFWGINQQDIKNQLNGWEGDLVLEVSSLGGDIFDAIPIYNMIKAHNGRVTANIYGNAASAATFIALAADDVSMVDNAFYLIHNVWGGAVGDAGELRKAADEMERFNDVIKDIYRKETGLTKSQLTKMMDKGEWWSAKEAKSHGFVDKVVEPSAILNKVEPVFMNCLKSEEAKKDLLNKINTMDKTNEAEVSNSIYNKVMDNVKEFLNKDTKTLDEASESKVVEIANELANEIKNEVTENEVTMAEVINNLKEEVATLKAQVEAKEVVAAEDKEATLNASVVDAVASKDPEVIEAPAKELTALDVMVNKMKENPQFKYKN